MLILLFVSFIVLFFLASVFIDDYYHDFLRIIIQFITATGAAIVMVAFVIVAYDFSASMVIDEKIAMYAEENQKIENQIDLIVSEYMEYESGTFEKLNADSSIALVSLYPELKSDELVQTQIATYQANNTKLKQLKEAKLNARVSKWWLYFGK